jgi:hypothetical protein
MGHKPQPQSIDREGAVQTNISFNREALERARLRNNPTESVEDPGRDRDIAIAAGVAAPGGAMDWHSRVSVPFPKEEGEPVADATLNWSNGQQVATIAEHGDTPFDGRLAVVAGVGASGPMPDRGADYPHGANMDELCNYGGRK